MLSRNRLLLSHLIFSLDPFLNIFSNYIINNLSLCYNVYHNYESQYLLFFLTQGSIFSHDISSKHRKKRNAPGHNTVAPSLANDPSISSLSQCAAVFLLICPLVPSANNICKQFGPNRPDLIWIQTVWHYDGIPERTQFRKIMILKISTDIISIKRVKS